MFYNLILLSYVQFFLDTIQIKVKNNKQTDEHLSHFKFFFCAIYCDTGADAGKKMNLQNFPVSRFYPIFPRFFTTFPRFFTNKI